MIALFSMGVSNFGIQDAHAAAPVISSSKITGQNEITVVYAATTTAVIADYTDLRLTTGNDARSVTSMTGSTSATHVLTFDGAVVGTAETATMDFGTGIADNVGGQANVADADQAITDGQAPVVFSAVATSSKLITLTMSEAMTENVNDSTDYTIKINGVASIPYVGTAQTSGSIITLNLIGGKLVQASTVTVSYVGGAANDLEDIVDIDLADFSNTAVTNNLVNDSWTCPDCIPPTLQETQINISSDNYIITTGDESIHITADVGDEVSVLLKITDNMSIDTIPFVGLYTNYVEMPDEMSIFYGNNFDNLKNTSTSFYEWNIRSDDIAYDYDGTVSWSNDPNVTLDGQSLMVPFTFTINEHMQTSQITVKIYDVIGNRLHLTLPVTLETAGNDPLNFDNMGKQKMLGFFNESVLSIMISELNGSEDTAPLSALLGIPDESLPVWTLDLATWAAEDKIDSADLIIATEYLINQ